MADNEKNPARVAGQLRRMIAQRRRSFWVVALFWVIPLLAALASWYYEGPWWLLALTIMGCISGLISFLANLSQYQDWKKRLAAIERGPADESVS